MNMQSLIDDLVEPNMIKADDGSDKPPKPNTGDVRMWEKK